MKNRKLKAVLVGLSFGGCFTPIWLDHPDVECVGVCDLDPKKANEFKERFPQLEVYASLEDVLADESVDAVHLVTCIPDHAKQTVQVLNAGKHCACTVPMATTLEEIREIFEHFGDYVRVESPAMLYEAYRLRDALISQMTYLAAMKYYVEAGGKSRGSAIYSSKEGQSPAKLGELFRFELDCGEFDEVVEEVSYAEGLKTTVRPVRPLPGDSGFFENVWRRYREDKNVY